MARRQYNSGAWTPERAQQQAHDRTHRAAPQRRPTPNVDRWRRERADPTSRLHIALLDDEEIFTSWTAPTAGYYSYARGNWATASAGNVLAYDPVTFQNIRVEFHGAVQALTGLRDALATTSDAFGKLKPPLCDCGDPANRHWMHSTDGCDFIEHEPDMTLQG